MFFGDLADMAGRRPVYILTFTIYVGANIGLALQHSYLALLILRCMQSMGSSSAIALGYGAVADIATSSERGKYMGYVSAGSMLGPSLGPVLGGILAEFLGWQSIFWFLVVIAGGFLVLYTLTVPETGRSVVGNGSIVPQSWNITVLEYLHLRRERQRLSSSTVSAASGRPVQAEHANDQKVHQKVRFPNPLRAIRIMLRKDMAIVLFCNALVYTAYHVVTATIPQLFQQEYDFNNLQIGFCYIPFGCGCALSSVICGTLLDRNYRRVASQIGFSIDRKNGDDLRDFPIEKARIEVTWPLLTAGLVCVIGYGWALERNAPLVVPLILLFFIGKLDT